MIAEPLPRVKSEDIKAWKNVPLKIERIEGGTEELREHDDQVIAKSKRGVHVVYTCRSWVCLQDRAVVQRSRLVTSCAQRTSAWTVRKTLYYNTLHQVAR